MTVTMERVLGFIRANDGIVLGDWARSPNGMICCRAVFPTTEKKPSLPGIKSPFIKNAINEFYPHCVLKPEYGNALVVKIDGGREFLILESNLEARNKSFDKGKVEYPSYPNARRNARPTTFLGVEGVLVEKS